MTKFQIDLYLLTLIEGDWSTVLYGPIILANVDKISHVDGVNLVWQL